MQKVCDSKDERDSKLACTKLACESGESRECLNAAKYYQVLLVGGEVVSALFQKGCDERGGMDCLYAKFFDKARDRMTDEYVRKMKKYLKKACDAGEKEGCKEFEKIARALSCEIKFNAKSDFYLKFELPSETHTPKMQKSCDALFRRFKGAIVDGGTKRRCGSNFASAFSYEPWAAF